MCAKYCANASYLAKRLASGLATDGKAACH